MELASLTAGFPWSRVGVIEASQIYPGSKLRSRRSILVRWCLVFSFSLQAAADATAPGVGVPASAFPASSLASAWPIARLRSALGAQCVLATLGQKCFGCSISCLGFRRRTSRTP